MVTASNNSDILDNNFHTITESHQQEESSNNFIHLHNVASHNNKTPSLSLSSSEKTQQQQQQNNTVNDTNIAIEQKPRPVTHARQLFVGNLPFRVRWQDLKDLFRKAGNVQRADVALSFDNRSKGHGTVLFATVQDAQRAIDMLHNYKWQGRVLEVREDRGFVELSSDIQHTSHPQPTIHFLPQLEKGLQQQFAQQQQQNHNNHRAVVDNIRMHHHHHHHHHRQSINNNNNNVEIIQGGRQLFVGNLPFHCQWQDVKDLFRNAGNILRADVVQGPDGRSRGFGTVLYATHEDAKKAMAMYDGFEFHGRQLRVHFDKFAPGPPVSHHHHHHHPQQPLTEQQQQQQRFTLPAAPPTATSFQPRHNFPPYMPTVPHHHQYYTHHLPHPHFPPLPYPMNFPSIAAAAAAAATVTSSSPQPSALPSIPIAEPTALFAPSTTIHNNNAHTNDTVLLQQHLLSLDDGTRTRLLQHPFQSPSSTSSPVHQPQYLSLGNNFEPQQHLYLTHPFATVEEQQQQQYQQQHQPSLPPLMHSNDSITGLTTNDNNPLLVGSTVNNGMTTMAEPIYSSSSTETTPSADLRASNLFTTHSPWAPTPPLPPPLTQPLVPPQPQHEHNHAIEHVNNNLVNIKDEFFSPPPPKLPSLPISPDEGPNQLADAVKAMTLTDGSAGLNTTTVQQATITITTKTSSGNNNNSNDTDVMITTTKTTPQAALLTSSSVWEPLSGFKY